jgi:asparagine synthase (glutamine-hydrolysing)
MRNQLLRDADWAGMAHGIEIRVPLVDVALLKSVAETSPILTRAAGKAALANAPAVPVPPNMVHRAKTGFVVPTRMWMNVPVGASAAARGEPTELQGLASRRWSRLILAKTSDLEVRAA